MTTSNLKLQRAIKLTLNSLFTKIFLCLARGKKDNITDKTFLYRLTLVASVVQPLTTIPQVVKIYTSHNVSGLSLFTWLG